MGFFDRFINTEVENEDPFWNSVTSEEQLDEILDTSIEKPLVILKHSNQCGTSFFAKRNLELINKSEHENVDFFLIDVIHQRALSRYLSERIGVRHESPQLFVIKNSEIIWHGSHHQVNEKNLKVALN
jgi:bacillithiol system protein YtxJ